MVTSFQDRPRERALAAQHRKNPLTFARGSAAGVYYGQMRIINPYLLFVGRVLLFQTLVALGWYYVVTHLP